jgi:type IX secretion system PorP/SprF family membrane protein
MSITHPDYYISYGVNNVNQGSISSGDVFMDKKPRVGIAQAGYRNRFSESLTLITNAMWRSQSDLPTNVEFNMKFLFKDKFWVGGGHRVDYANNAQLGVLMGKLRFGYVYEWPMLKSYLLPNRTHEFMVSMRLFGGNAAIW